MKVQRLVTLLGLGLPLLAGHVAGAADVPTYNQVHTQYIELCSGCHGIQGRSVPTAVPTLKERAGYFLCNAESRAYLVRLPNVALAPVGDEDLAGIVNFVVFGLGGGSVPQGAAPYTPEEIAGLRSNPIGSVKLRSLRGDVVRRLIDDCDAPEAMLEYSSHSRVPASPE